MFVFVLFVFDPMLCLYCGGIGGDESRNAMEEVHYGIVDIPLVGVYCTK